MSLAERPGPSVAKVRAAPAVRERSLALVAGLEGRVRDLLELADVVSEGASRSEPEGPVYYGSTHLLMTPMSRGGRFADLDVAALARIAARDPHLRVRALRLARLEAMIRAGSALGPLRAEVSVDLGARGLAIHVEVSAPLLASGARARSHKSAGRTER